MINMSEKNKGIFKKVSFVITAFNLFVLVLYLIPKKLAVIMGISMDCFGKYAFIYLALFTLIALTFNCISCFYNVLVKEAK